MAKKLNPWAAVGVALLYVVLVLAASFIGYLSPVCWAYYTVLASLLAVGPFYWLAARWQKFGVGTFLGILVCLFCIATGEAKGFLSRAIFIGFGILSDLARMWMGNGSSKGLSFAYPLLAVGNIGWIIRLWTMPEWYVEGALDEMGESYANGIAALQTPLHLVLVIVLTAAMAVFAIWIAGKTMKKSASLLD